MRLLRRRPPPDDVTQDRPADDIPHYAEPEPRRSLTRRIVGGVLKVALAYYALCVLLLVIYRFAWPPVTGVQLQRRIEARAAGRAYTFDRAWVRLDDLPGRVPHAVVAAEDGRFYAHSGFDLQEMRHARRGILGGGRMRGASTITQQLVKNLFGVATRNPLVGALRKVYDWTLTPVAELVLGKHRILELYLNTAEWGDGVFGIDAGARHRYGVGARQLTRSQAAGMAALLPNPHVRTTRNTAAYRREILRRMARRGW
jgi:monofunctional biosynthetic peptidoglycan transglycosylase